MKKCFNFIFPIILSLMFLTVPSYAMATGGSGGRNGYTFYDNDDLNQIAINEWNNMSLVEQTNYIQGFMPIFLSKIGVKSSEPIDYYEMNLFYLSKQQAYKQRYETVEAFKAGTSKDVWSIYCSDYDSVGWYDSLADYLVDRTDVLGGKLVLDNYGSKGLTVLIQQMAEQEKIDSGIVYATVLSYENINSSAFYNLNQYTRFKSVVASYLNDYDYFIMLYQNRSGSYKVELFFLDKNQQGVYRNGPTGEFFIANYSLTNKFNGRYVEIGPNGDIVTNTVMTNQAFSYQGLNLGTSSKLPEVLSTSITMFTLTSSTQTSGVPARAGLYLCQSSKQNLEFYTSQNGWVNSKGHFESRFQFEPYFGKVPSVSVGASDITNFFNLNFTINVPGSGSGGSGSGGSGSGGSGSGGSGDGFNWSDLFGPIGNFIGGLIEGIASLVARVISGLNDIVDSITNAIELVFDAFSQDGIIFSFLRVFISWLPEPIPTLLTTFFILAVVFGVIKLIKGALS